MRGFGLALALLLVASAGGCTGLHSLGEEEFATLLRSGCAAADLVVTFFATGSTPTSRP